MRTIFLVICCLFLINPAFADDAYEPLLNTVTLQLSAEQWLTTKTALVTVGINAGVSDQAIEKMQSDVMAKLNQISNKADWHIISYNRSQDASGLERMQMSAQIRLASPDLSGLRDKAKSISKPGFTFTIDNVEFTPSEDEVRSMTTVLRNMIYQQAKDEIANLQKMYPEQKYFLHNLNFMTEVQPQPMLMKTMAAAAPSNLSVGDKLRISAVAILGAAPNADVTKIVHN